MADLPIESRNKPVKQAEQPKSIKVTMENYGPVAVHYLQLIYQRLGYIIKLLEGQK